MNKANLKSLKTFLISAACIAIFMALGIYLIEIDKFVVEFTVLFVVTLLGISLYVTGVLGRLFK